MFHSIQDWWSVQSSKLDTNRCLGDSNEPGLPHYLSITVNTIGEAAWRFVNERKLRAFFCRCFSGSSLLANAWNLQGTLKRTTGGVVNSVYSNQDHEESRRCAVIVRNNPGTDATSGCGCEFYEHLTADLSVVETKRETGPRHGIVYRLSHGVLVRLLFLRIGRATWHRR